MNNNEACKLKLRTFPFKLHQSIDYARKSFNVAIDVVWLKFRDNPMYL